MSEQTSAISSDESTQQDVGTPLSERIYHYVIKNVSNASVSANTQFGRTITWGPGETKSYTDFEMYQTWGELGINNVNQYIDNGSLTVSYDPGTGFTWEQHIPVYPIAERQYGVRLARALEAHSGVQALLAGMPANCVAATSPDGVQPAGCRYLVPADIPNLDTSKITTGTFGPGQLGTGDPKSADAVLRGDGSWGTVEGPKAGPDILGLVKGGIALVGTITGTSTLTQVINYIIDIVNALVKAGVIDIDLTETFDYLDQLKQKVDSGEISDVTLDELFTKLPALLNQPSNADLLARIEALEAKLGSQQS
jgi:hypothetical protein